MKLTSARVALIGAIIGLAAAIWREAGIDPYSPQPPRRSRRFP